MFEIFEHLPYITYVDFLNFQVQKAVSGSESGGESSSDSGESDEEKKEKSNGEKPKEKSVSREPSAEKNQQEVMIDTPFHAVSYNKTCVKRPLSKRPKNGFQDQLSLNAGQKYCRMLSLEHSAILSTFIKLPVVIKNFVLSIFEGFTQLLL